MLRLIRAFAVGLCLATVARPDDVPQFPSPDPEHAWLQQFVGDWTIETEVAAAPGQPPMKCQGRETVKAVGGFWIVSNLESRFGETSMHAVMTLGYDPATKQFVGTWIDSGNAFLWKYQGSLDAEQKVLTLESEGPNPMDGFKIARFRDVVEFKSRDERVMTSQIQQPGGKWVTFVTGVARRSHDSDLFKPL